MNQMELAAAVVHLAGMLNLQRAGV
jgi:hypothetical protein